MDQAMIGFIGAGNMGRSLAGGLLKSGWDRQKLVLADPVPEQRQVVGNLLGLTVYADNNEVADRADVLVLATKPQQMRAVCKGLAPAVQRRKPLIVSIAAGIRINNIEDWLGGNLPIVRVMPNTPALVNSGASGLFANPRASDRQRELAESILRTVGVTIWLSSEDQLDAVTGVSGSGPAYFFLAMEALEQAAVEQGLDAATARLLAVETAFGAAKMALESGTDPAELRRNVTSPGGTTERAITKFQDGGFERLFKQAVAAATARSRELADMLGGE
ncbi:MAG: pyrroline-5-carboxylate reductase [Acidiferrobacterales bacterium]